MGSHSSRILVNQLIKIKVLCKDIKYSNILILVRNRNVLLVRSYRNILIRIIKLNLMMDNLLIMRNYYWLLVKKNKCILMLIRN
jgi:hypothetical protein